MGHRDFKNIRLDSNQYVGVCFGTFECYIRLSLRSLVFGDRCPIPMRLPADHRASHLATSRNATRLSTMTIPAKASVTNDLKTKQPCRDSQFDALTCLLGHESLPSPPAICLTGLKNSGKRTILRAALDSLATPQQAVQSTWVDCRETFSSHLLFDRIVNRINAMKQPQPTERIKVLNDINSFVVEVTRALNAIEGKFILVSTLLNLELIEGS